MPQKIITRVEAKALGLKRYFLGTPCRNGHVCERYASNKGCLMCMVIGHKKWLKGNREKFREAQRKFYHSGKYVAWRKEWMRANRKHVNERGYAYDRDHPEIRKAISAASDHKRRARKRRSRDQHTAKDILAILNSQRYRCAYCKLELKRKGWRTFHVDHIVPLSRGGGNGRANLQVLCEPCNLRKSAKDPITFAREIGLLL